MNKKAIVFDMDGTLLDSMTHWYDTGRIAIEPYFYKESKEEQEKILKMDAKRRVWYLVDKMDKSTKEKFMKTWDDLIYERYLTVVEIKEHVVEYLEMCRSKNIKMAIATATKKHIAIEALKRLDLLKYFEFVSDESDVGLSKWHPDIYINAAKKLGFKITETAVFEDNANFAKVAKNAGFFTVGVYDVMSKNKKEEMISFCDIYIEDYNQLIKK